MARLRRLFVPGVAHHVIQRGNDRGDMFRSPADHEVFLYALRDALARYPLEVHAYVLMKNHVHFMVTPGSAAALPGTMQALGRRYVRYFNDRYQRTGGLFDGRYRSLMVADERYWFTCMRYIELNPVRAGIVASPADYLWSSYRAHAFGKTDLVVAPHWLYMALGATSSDREKSWRELCGAPLADDELAEIRAAVRRGRLPNRVVFPDTAGV
jgi:putative transposase